MIFVYRLLRGLLLYSDSYSMIHKDTLIQGASKLTAQTFRLVCDTKDVLEPLDPGILMLLISLLGAKVGALSRFHACKVAFKFARRA